MTTINRVMASLLTLSVAGVVALISVEGFDPVATRPVPNDPYTYGHGATVRKDGKPVQKNDTITRPAARALLQKQVDDEYSAAIRRCAGDVPMAQNEFDAAVDLAYNIGWPKVCSSTMLRQFRAGRYAEGCRAIFLFDRLHGRKCSLPENRNRKDGCRGIMKRRASQYQMCMGEQS
jgi:lysozyme